MTSHRKASVLARKRNLSRAVAPLVERLEDRRLLTALNGDDPATSAIRYRFPGASDEEWGYIVAGPGVEAEVIWMNVDEDTGATLGTKDDPILPGPRADGAPNYSSYPWSIHVTKGNLDSYIMATYQRAEPGRIVTDPFGENAGDLRVTNNRNGQEVTVSTAGGSGRLFLGGIVTINENPYPVLDDPDAGAPGVIVDDGVDLGRFLFGGTITGLVDIGGTMDLFYAGGLLTGGADGVADIPANFHVKGDLQNLVVKTTIGGVTGADLDSPVYLTRFQAKVDGRLGQIRAYDSFIGSVNVLGGTAATQWTGYQNEVERRGAGADTRFLQGYLGDGTFFNDTFETAQFVGSINSDQLGENSVNILGTLNASDAPNNQDWFDYYGVALYAGQTVEVQLVEYMLGSDGKPMLDPVTGKPMLMTDVHGRYANMTRIGVFDPDQRLIATDYSDVDAEEVEGKVFRFTADRPGVYRFAVAGFGDSDFATHNYATGTTNYGIRITGVGNVTLGGVVATNSLLDSNESGVGFNVENGDLGAVYAGGNLMSRPKVYDLLNPGAVYSPLNVLDEDLDDDGTLSGSETDLDGDGFLDQAKMGARVMNGNLRTLQGGTIGVVANEGAGAGVDVHVPKGLVGLVRATNDRLWLNPNYYEYMFDYGETWYDHTDPAVVRAVLEVSPHVSGDYQLISAAGRFYGVIVTKQKIGTIRAGDMATRSPSVITVNADQTDDTDEVPTTNEDGVIDLIDVVGDFGWITAGGPHINTGPGGNVRYINVGGDVYTDYAFGGGAPQRTVFEVGESAEFYDDSGSMITLAPSGGQLAVTTYGIRGSGGVAIVRVDSSADITVTGSTQYGSTNPAEIGRINVTGTGPGGVAPSVNINGTQLDVFEITGGDFTNIINNTKGGELVNITANSVNSIQAETIGLARSNTPAAVNSATIRSDAYPFSQQRILVNVAGAVGLISATKALGNISAGSITTLRADADVTHTASTYDQLMREGIVGPVYTSGDMGEISIGAGIAPAGTGNPARAGLFAVGRINAVRGDKADIRGIVASDTSIGTIQLTGGSLINANIFVGDLADVREISLGHGMAHSGGGTLNRPVYEIGEISIVGGGSGSTTPNDDTTVTPTPGSSKKRKYVWVNLKDRKAQAAAAKKAAAKKKPATPAVLSGGIIGTLIAAADIGTVNVSGGFGIFDSAMFTVGDGVVNMVQTQGMGMHDVEITGGAKVNNIIANGDGKLAKVTSYSSSVRWSEYGDTAPFDPFTGWQPNPLTDLYVYFKNHTALAVDGDKLSKNASQLEGVTNTGMISNMAAAAQRELGLLQAWRLQTTGDGNYAGLVYEGFSFANIIRNIQVTNDVVGYAGNGWSGVRILTGKLPSFAVGRDVTGLRLTVSGPIGTLNFGRNVDATTRVFATGKAGTIDKIGIGGGFAGQIRAEHKIKSIAIKGAWTGKIWEAGKIQNRNR